MSFREPIIKRVDRRLVRLFEEDKAQGKVATFAEFTRRTADLLESRQLDADSKKKIKRDVFDFRL